MGHRLDALGHALEDGLGNALKGGQWLRLQEKISRSSTYHIVNVIIGSDPLVQRAVHFAQNQHPVGLVLHELLHSVQLQPTDSLAQKHLAYDVLQELLVLRVGRRSLRVLDALQLLLRLLGTSVLDQGCPLHQCLSARERVKGSRHGGGLFLGLLLHLLLLLLLGLLLAAALVLS